jgi:hypothetical protein
MLIPGGGQDQVTYRCDKCRAEVIRTVPRWPQEGLRMDHLTTPSECREQAARCRLLADTATNERVQVLLRSMAQMWTELAEKAEQLQPYLPARKWKSRRYWSLACRFCRPRSYRGVMPKQAEIDMAGMTKVIEPLGLSGELKAPLPTAERFVDLQYLKRRSCSKSATDL